MSQINTAPETQHWLPTGQKLVDDIVELFSKNHGEYGDILDSDFAKLLNAGNKLEEFIRALQSGKTVTEAHKTWHDLRNIIGTIQGYCELIQEEIDHSKQGALNNQLLNLLNLCQQLQAVDQEPAPALDETGVVALANTKVGTILVVDDQEESREILRRYLKQQKHTILEAESGRQMLEILAQEEVDLILLDLILPEMDGYQLLQKLKQHEQWRAIPVIVVSGSKDTERVIRCIEAGAEDYLFKPFNQVLLQARISAGVERKRWHDREQHYRQELELNQRFIRSVFGRYLSEEIVDTLLEQPDGLDLGGSQRQVTVMMADIRGFTSIAEQLPPHRVVRLLNNYLGTMTDIIMRHNGTVDEFIGDAILAIFGAPISRYDDTDRAINCALAMQQAMSGINARNKEEDLPAIEMGISLNTGLVVAGNIGSEKRAKYGVVGHTVNQTARIEEHCPAGKILVSESTFKLAQSKLLIGEEKTINAKGILSAIKIYELNGIEPQ